MKKSLLAILGIGGAVVVVLVVLSSNGMLPLQGDVAQDSEEETVNEGTTEDEDEGELVMEGSGFLFEDLPDLPNEEEGSNAEGGGEEVSAPPSGVVECKELKNTVSFGDSTVNSGVKSGTRTPKEYDTPEEAIAVAVAALKTAFESEEKRKKTADFCEAKTIKDKKGFTCPSGCSAGLIEVDLVPTKFEPDTVPQRLRSGKYTATATLRGVGCTVKRTCTSSSAPAAWQTGSAPAEPTY